MEILMTILMFVPFVFMLWLANLAYRKQVEGQVESANALKWISYGLVIALYLGILFLGLMLQFVGLAGDEHRSCRLAGRTHHEHRPAPGLCTESMGAGAGWPPAVDLPGAPFVCPLHAAGSRRAQCRRSR